MKPLDFAVIGLYALAMLGIGWYYSRRTETVDDYLLGGRRMNPIMVGLSLFATMTSTLSYLAVPGEVVRYGPMMVAQLASLPFVYMVVGWWLIPAIMRQRNVTSGYELLENRLGTTGRLLAAGMFVALRTVWMASILYATSATVMTPLLGLHPSWTPWLGVALGVLTVVYTSQGGIRAVVMTDALQSIIMLCGALATIGVATMSLGGLGGWWPSEWAPHWQEPVFWFSASERVTFMGAFLNMFVWAMCNAGSDQMALQRYFSTRDETTARRSYAIQLTTDLCMTSLLALAGLAVLGYFTAHPEQLGIEGASIASIENADQLFPKFVVHVLPAGLTGLVIAAILSAAMSSLSSGMNSASAVLVNDFLNRRSADAPSQEAQVLKAKVVSVGVGVVAILVSTVVGNLATNLLTLCINVVNLLTAPIFVLFFLALFVPWATPLGAVAATVASVGIGVSIAFGGVFDLEFLWTAPCSLITGIVVGDLVSVALPRNSPKKPAGSQDLSGNAIP